MVSYDKTESLLGKCLYGVFLYEKNHKKNIIWIFYGLFVLKNEGAPEKMYRLQQLYSFQSFSLIIYIRNITQ